MTKYEDFIIENTALSGTTKIVVDDIWGNRIGEIPLGSLTPPNDKKKLYSFGVLSDVHIGQYDAIDDFTNALQYLSTETDFICISGDLVHYDDKDLRETYANLVTNNAEVPVYACAGNHDGYNSDIENLISTYTGYPLYYSIGIDNKGGYVDSDTSQTPKAYGNNVKDVFIFVGVKSNTAGSIFTEDELGWLADTLEANRNKRCFVFQHVRPDDACGNALGIYDWDIWKNDAQEVVDFERLLRTYPNIVLFHGHSHLKFDLQQYADSEDLTAEYRKLANIDKVFGCWSVHVPSITVPRSTQSVENPSRWELKEHSEGYVVDVYENGIHLRGRDFENGTYLPIASYWLDTTF